MIKLYAYKRGQKWEETIIGESKIKLRMDNMGNSIRRDIIKDWGVGLPKYNETDLMTKEEIHDFALEIIFDFIKKEGYDILSVNSEYGFNPSFVGKKSDDIYAFFIKSDIAPIHPILKHNEKAQCIKFCEENNMIPIFCPVSFGATDWIRFEKGIALVGDSYYCNFKGFEKI